MSGWAEFGLAVGFFLISHALPLRPQLRAKASAALGARGFTVVYSLVSLLALGWLIVAAGRAPHVQLWPPAPWQAWAPFAAMLPACIMVTCALGVPNPLSFGGPADGFDPDRPGIAGVARHPLLWALSLWALAHMVPNGDLAHVAMFGGLGGFALAGMVAIDARRRRLWGAARWQQQARATSALPLAALLRGRWRPQGPWPIGRIAAGAGLYLALLFLHRPVMGLSPLPVW